MTVTSVEEAIYVRSTTHPGLSALIGDRCYPKQLPDEAEFPAMTFQRISDPDRATTHEAGPGGLSGPRFQLDVWAETATEVKEVAEQVRLCWEGFRGVVDGFSIYACIKADRREGYDDKTNLHREILDYFIWYPEPTS